MKNKAEIINNYIEEKNKSSYLNNNQSWNIFIVSETF
jgi:hypothetical protein